MLFVASLARIRHEPHLPFNVVGHIAYRRWTDNDKVKHHHTAIVIDSFTLLGRPIRQTGESASDPDDTDMTVVMDADQCPELHDDNPFPR